MLWKLITILIFLFFTLEQATAKQSGKDNICSSPGCKDAAELLKSNMDQKEKPCSDFYNFACGGFLKNTPIPKEQYETGHLSILQNKIFNQIKELLLEKVDPSEPRIFELAKTYYRSCLDESTKEKNLESLLNVIRELGGWPLLEGTNWNQDEFDVFTFERRLRKLGYQPNNRIFRIFTFPNLLNTSQSFLFIGPPETLVKPKILSGAFMNKIVQAYYKYMVDVAVLLGANRKMAELYLRKAIEFEKLIITGVSEHRTIVQSLNPQRIEKFYEDADEYPWLEYINDMVYPIAQFKNRSVISVENLDYIKKVIYSLDNTPKKTVANYMIWKVIAESIRYLPDEFREKAFEFDKIRSEKEAPPLKQPRWKECLNLMIDKNGGLGVAVSSMYIRRYFDDSSRKETEPIVSSVAAAFKEILNEVPWMAPSVRVSALKKVEYLRKIIAYPDELLNDKKIDEYSRSLELTPDNHFQNFLNLQRFHYEFDLMNLNQATEVNRWEFFSDSTTVNAYYFSLANTFVLLAAILQRPLFNIEWPSYATFGSMGFIIGHEIMHAYDAHRVAYNAAGDLTGWMNGPSKVIFLNRTQCFVDQYSQYIDEQANMTINAGLTLNENVADTGGLKIAYRAYRNWVRDYGEDPLPPQLQNYTTDQLFFVSSINFLCQKSTKERRKDNLKVDVHTPDDIRALGMLSNSKEFAETFNCPVGSRLNPGKRCTIWE